MAITDVFSVIQTFDMTLEGFGEHLARKRSGWTVGTRTPLGDPLTLDTISTIYQDLTLEELANAIADDFFLCVEIDEVARIINYKEFGACSKQLGR